ncbi:MAG: hypothetical protein Q7S21_04125 [archaeon]|nr:hypothetical protein [archaeon]
MAPKRKGSGKKPPKKPASGKGKKKSLSQKLLNLKILLFMAVKQLEMSLEILPNIKKLEAKTPKFFCLALMT